MPNPNLQVSFEDYRRCVADQIVFLVNEKLLDAGASVSEADLRVYYQNGVSVDAAAQDAR